MISRRAFCYGVLGLVLWFGGFFVVSDRLLSLYFFQSEILIVKVLSVYTALR